MTAALNASPITDAVLAVHGGAGAIGRGTLPPDKDAACRAGLHDALQRGGDVLRARGSALDAVCAALCCLEDNPLFNAGRGSVLTYNGHAEMDAAIMDGTSGLAGAIAGVRTIKNPILLARAVMEQSPFVLLVGPGAEEFAQTQGLTLAEPGYFLTPEREAQWQNWKRQHDEEMQLSEDGAPAPSAGGDFKFGTVGAVARDTRGALAAATSTGGMTGKRYGRVGDSPLVGAGTWAANATCAVSATGHGEHFIRQAVAHDIHARMVYGGATLAEATQTVIHQTLPAAGGAGGVIAIDARGSAVLPFNTEGMFRGVLRADGSMTIGIYPDELYTNLAE